MARKFVWGGLHTQMLNRNSLTDIFLTDQSRGETSVLSGKLAKNKTTNYIPLFHIQWQSNKIIPYSTKNII